MIIQNHRLPRLKTRPVILLATLAVIGLTGCSKKGEKKGGDQGRGGPVPVNIAEAVAKDMPVELQAIGTIEPVASVAVKAQVSGKLLEVHFKEGDEVKKGQLLFSIDPMLYAAQLAQAEANMARSRVTAQNASREAERAAELSKKGAVSKEQLDQARAASEAAAAALKADEALAEIAKVQLGYAKIESPIDGVTGAISVKAGNVINGNDSLVTINQIAPVYARFSVPEQHLATIRAVMAEGALKLTARESQKGGALGEGELSFFNNTVDSSTGSILLTGSFPNEDRALWPGGFVEVILHVSTQTGVTVVPVAAITNGPRGQQVYVAKEDNTAELKPVVVERTVGEEAVISQGVTSGEKVIVNGQSRLTPGAKLDVQPAAAPATP